MLAKFRQPTLLTGFHRLLKTYSSDSGRMERIRHRGDNRLHPTSSLTQAKQAQRALDKVAEQLTALLGGWNLV